MYHIAIVDDEEAFTTLLSHYLAEYEKENNIKFKVSVFHDGAEILDGYENVYDVILLDIEMPKVNGMDTAFRIREQDGDVALMFITNMANYAIHGYEVGALDFVMKPINYYTFSMKLTRVLKRVRRKQQQEILLTLPDGAVKLSISQIEYIEVQNRMLYYHTTEGVYSVKGTMTAVEKQFAAYSFAKCNHWYMVNLMHVKEIRKSVAV